MLNENIKALRVAKGMSQEELALKLSVVRQTVSKWEKGISVPDSDMLVTIARTLDTDVNTLLGESDVTSREEETRALKIKLELLSEELAKQNEKKRKLRRAFFIILGAAAILLAVGGLIENIYILKALGDMSSGEAFIGGFDGPSKIYVASNIKIVRCALIVTAIVFSVIGVYKTRRRGK